MILVGFVVGRAWIVPVGAVAAAIAISAPAPVLSGDFALGLLVGAANTAVGLLARASLRRAWSSAWRRKRWGSGAPA